MKSFHDRFSGVECKTFSILCIDKMYDGCFMYLFILNIYIVYFIFL